MSLASEIALAARREHGELMAVSAEELEADLDRTLALLPEKFTWTVVSSEPVVLLLAGEEVFEVRLREAGVKSIAAWPVKRGELLVAFDWGPVSHDKGEMIRETLWTLDRGDTSKLRIHGQISTTRTGEKPDERELFARHLAGWRG